MSVKIHGNSITLSYRLLFVALVEVKLRTPHQHLRPWVLRDEMLRGLR